MHETSFLEYTLKYAPRRLPLLILQSLDWLAAFHLDLLQAILFIAVKLSAPVFLASCFEYCSPGTVPELSAK
jgi:hypothetical protein